MSYEETLLVDKDPKFSIELLLVGCILFEPDKIDIVRAKVRKKDFTDPVVGSIFETVGALYDSGAPITDHGYLFSALHSQGLISRDASGITQEKLAKAIIEAVPTSIDFYCQEIVRESVRLEAFRACAQMRNELESVGSDPFAITSTYGAKITLISERAVFSSQTIYEFGEKSLADKEHLIGKPVSQFMSTGLAGLDSDILGYGNGEFVIVGARPSCGKTVFAMQSAMYNAMRGKRVLFISLEMRGGELAQRLLSEKTRIPYGLINSGNLTREQFDNCKKQLEGLKCLKLNVYDETSTMTKVRAMVKLASTGGLDAVYVDYLGKIKTEGGGFKRQRHEEVASISGEFQALAKDFGIPFVVLAQINRAGDESPKMSHLKESGNIEQDADKVLLIDNKPGNNSGSAAIVVAKNRNGNLGTVRVGWEPGGRGFYDLTSF